MTPVVLLSVYVTTTEVSVTAVLLTIQQTLKVDCQGARRHVVEPVLQWTNRQWSLSSSGPTDSGACPPVDQQTVEPVLQWTSIQWSLSSSGPTDSGACPPVDQQTVEPVLQWTSRQWSLSSSDAPYIRTVEPVLQWCPILQDSGACPPVMLHTSGPVNNGACPLEVFHASGSANSRIADGHTAAHKAASLPAGTFENGQIHLDQHPDSVIICE